MNSAPHSHRIERALERARDDARSAPPVPFDRDGAITRHVAIGDPQADIETFFTILDLHGLLGDDGRLHADVHLVSMGDHFDWGPRRDRAHAAESAIALLAWLAAHGETQVTLLLGNHDLGRVGELARFDDATFARAQAEADALYHGRAVDRAGESDFLRRYPDLPSAEVAARDLSTFRVAQRDLVTTLLRARRFRAAVAPAPDLVLTHAGVTHDDLDACGLARSLHADAAAVAEAVNRALDDAVAHWTEGPLAIGAVHRPGNAAEGEGRGIFFQRPGHPAHEPPDVFEGPPRRRFDPRTLPLGLTQAIGHIRDAKCRALLHEWADGARATDGVLRHLRTDGTNVRYMLGVPSDTVRDAATMLFVDGGMAHVAPESYELFDLTTRASFGRARSSPSRRTP